MQALISSTEASVKAPGSVQNLMPISSRVKANAVFTKSVRTGGSIVLFLAQKSDLGSRSIGIFVSVLLAFVSFVGQLLVFVALGPFGPFADLVYRPSSLSSALALFSFL